jgi:hypothetical protein
MEGVKRSVHSPFDKPWEMGFIMMEDRYNRVDSALRQLEDIQAKHVMDFDNMLMPDLETQNEERDRAVAVIKKEVDRFVASAGQNPTDETESMIKLLGDRIRVLLRQNEILKSKVNSHRDRLRESMKGVVKGKHAIGAYGSPAHVLNRPRAISLTN